ncbi:hypothetical protein [Dickeya fangzhongdai]|uniref:hypothetical protein n=1 Tax=Dickeya fangzhongdai TaxID=1778540 RepID=UPI0023E429A4|nr:hypothetical protein [Dickeya fangzhongdai]WES87420.1 hypothetical protein PQ617_14350 [Dickeya fangzhongdai]
MHKETMHKEITDKQLSGKACTVKHHLIWINNSGGGKATTRLAVPPLKRKLMDGRGIKPIRLQLEV